MQHTAEGTAIPLTCWQRGAWCLQGTAAPSGSRAHRWLSHQAAPPEAAFIGKEHPTSAESTEWLALESRAPGSSVWDWHGQPQSQDQIISIETWKTTLFSLSPPWRSITPNCQQPFFPDSSALPPSKNSTPASALCPGEALSVCRAPYRPPIHGSSKPCVSWHSSLQTRSCKCRFLARIDTRVSFSSPLGLSHGASTLTCTSKARKNHYN